MHSRSLNVMDFVGPILGAIGFVFATSRVPEPARRTFNAVFAAGAIGVYLSGGFGAWELLYVALATPVVFLGMRSYRWIGVAWLMHAAWDIPHYYCGNPIWPFMPASSLGCAIFDVLISVWFFAGAPGIVTRENQALNQVAAKRY